MSRSNDPADNASHSHPGFDTRPEEAHDSTADQGTEAAASAAAPGSPPGYEILGVLGRGGMGVVYKAWQSKLNRPVAVKMILAGAHAGPEHLARFRQEVEAVSRLQHPHIVQVHEVGEYDGRPFFSLELVEGGSLAQRLNGTPQAPASAALLVEQLARAMQAAHEQGIIHRDLKPANVLLTKGGTPKINDFGLAKQLDAASALGGQERTPTVSGAVLGTPSYMAPEQAQGKAKEVGPAADVYALGAILYELMTGRPPFKAATELETLFQVVSVEPVPPSRLQPKVPRPLETICLKCLQKEPKKRYATALALAEDLQRFLHNEPILARPVSLAERAVKWARRRPAVAALLALVVVVAAAGFGLVTWQWLEAESARGQAVLAQQNAEERRRQAEDAKQKEIEQRHRAEQAQQAEAERKLQLQRLSAGLLLERGQALGEQDDASHGLLWMARALEVAPAADADLQRVIRTSLGDWGRQLHPLRFGLGKRYTLLTAVFSPDGKRVATGSNKGEFVIWDAATGQPVGGALLSRDKGVNWVHAVAFSPDGKKLLTGSSDRMARLWDAETSTLLGAPLPHPQEVTKVAFGPDGKTCFTVCKDNVLRLWDVVEGKPIGEAMSHAAEITIAGFSPDGKTVATRCAGEKQARVWDASSGQALFELPMSSVVFTVVYSPDGKTILTTGDGSALLWDASTGKPTGELVQFQSSNLTAAAFSPNGKQVVIGNSSGEVRLWSVPSGKPLGLPLKHGGTLAAVAFSPDGRLMLSAGWDQTARVWDVASRKLVGAPVAHQAPIGAAAFSADSQTFLTWTTDRLAHVWEVAKNPIVARKYRFMGSLTAAAISPPFKHVAIGLEAKEVRLFDAASGKAIGMPLARTGIPKTLAFSPDGKLLVVGCRDGWVQWWEVETGKPFGEPMQRPDGVNAVAFSPDGKTLIALGNKNAQLWEVATGKPLGVALSSGQADCVAFSPDSRQVVMGGQSGYARVWDTASGKPITPHLKHENNVLAVAFSPDGKLVMTGSVDETARLWDAATGKAVSPALVHQGRIDVVAFSPDGETVLTGSADRTARLWDVATGQPRCPPMTHPRDVYTAAFSPDGTKVLTGCTDGKGRWWDVATGRLLAASVPEVSGFRLGISFSPDGKTAWGGRGLVSVPEPLPSDVPRLAAWVQLRTGLEMDADGVVGVLDGPRWQALHQRLVELGGPPGP